MVDGAVLLAFSGCDYLGLSHHPKVLEAIDLGLRRYGAGANGSRTTTGSSEAHVALEAELADFLGQPAALLTPAGSLANLAACEALATRHGKGLIDEMSHGSLAAAARAAGLALTGFAHGSTDAARAALTTDTTVAVEHPSFTSPTHQPAPGYADQRQRTGYALLTDGVFGASGELAQVDALFGLLNDGNSLLIDESHALGVIGDRGAGCAAGLSPALPSSVPVVVTASLAKAIGCFGGVVAGGTDIVEAVQSRSIAYRGSTPIPPAMAEGARTALSLLRSGELLDRLRQNIAHLRSVFSTLGLRLPASEEVPVFAITSDDEDREQRLLRAAEEAGLLLPLIGYPGGPASRYFRIAVSACHEHEDLERLTDVLSLVFT